MMKWIARERPKIDRIACPWLIARFVDKKPEFPFIPSAQVKTRAVNLGAIPYDVNGVEIHARRPAADTNRLDLARQYVGLLQSRSTSRTTSATTTNAAPRLRDV
jgi:hypothetical protein